MLFFFLQGSDSGMFALELRGTNSGHNLKEAPPEYCATNAPRALTHGAARAETNPPGRSEAI